MGVCQSNIALEQYALVPMILHRQACTVEVLVTQRNGNVSQSVIRLFHPKESGLHATFSHETHPNRMQVLHIKSTQTACPATHNLVQEESRTGRAVIFSFFIGGGVLLR